MTQRFKAALVAFAALALGFGIVAFALGLFEGTPSTQDVTADGGPEAETSVESGEGLEGNPSLEGSGDGEPGRRVLPANGRGHSTSLIGIREPHGIDMSDPAVRGEALSKLVRQTPIDWAAVAAILKIHDGEVDEAVREAMMRAITRAGNRRTVLLAFQQLRDPSMTDALIESFDDRDVDSNAKRAILRALATMPGADDATVALALESRLSDDPRADKDLLHAIANRGGNEGARALVEYIARVDKPQLINQYLLQALDLRSEPAAVPVIAEALGSGTLSPEAQQKLLELAAQPGVKGLSEAVIALDRDGVSAEVRDQALRSLARIGGTQAVAYLLEKADEPGKFGETAIQSLGRLGGADVEGKKLLMKALEESDRNPRAELFRQQVVRALGTFKDPEAAAVVAKYVGSREVGVSRAAIQALGSLGSRAETHVPLIVDQWTTGDDTTRMRVVIALGTIGGDKSLSALEQMKGSEEGMSASLVRTLNATLNNLRKRKARGSDDRPLIGRRGGR